MDTQHKIQHLLWRTGFGPSSPDWANWVNLDVHKAWALVKQHSTAQPALFDVADASIKARMMGAEEAETPMERTDRVELRKLSNRNVRTLNLRWLEEMVHSPAQLREKMAMFWHGHFATRNINILYQQQLLDVFRKHALGNFRDLLFAVSKSAAMLDFLNNKQNRKGRPNENFAREVMELFTLGRGHYTEQDIKEAARAFTGWNFRLDGAFLLRQRTHDEGSKTILGKTGNWTGDDVLNMLLENRETARFLVRKLYRFLVNEVSPIPENRLHMLANVFYDAQYEIMPLLDAIFTSDWFYEPANVGTRIKGPIELWVGLRRLLQPNLPDPDFQLRIQRVLDQVLFSPPNVAGWPGGTAWIDSTSLLFRMQLPLILAGQQTLNIRPKVDDDLNGGRSDEKPNMEKSEAGIQWASVEAVFKNVPTAALIDRVAQFVWQIPVAPPADVLRKYTQPEHPLRTVVLRLLSTPEYQMA